MTVSVKWPRKEPWTEDSLLSSSVDMQHNARKLAPIETLSYLRVEGATKSQWYPTTPEAGGISEEPAPVQIHVACFSSHLTPVLYANDLPRLSVDTPVIAMTSDSPE